MPIAITPDWRRAWQCVFGLDEAWRRCVGLRLRCVFFRQREEENLRQKNHLNSLILYWMNERTMRQFIRRRSETWQCGARITNSPLMWARQRSWSWTIGNRPPLTLTGLKWIRSRVSSSLVSTSPTNDHGPNTPRQLWIGHDNTFSPSGDWKDLAWVPRSTKGSIAAPWRASMVASLPGMAIARHLTVRCYIGYGPVCMCMAQFITGAKLPDIQDLYTRRCQRWTPVTQIIDCSLCLCTASGTGAASQKGTLTASNHKP